MSELHHDVPYDPVRAHQYYLLRRQLKGRHKSKKIEVGRTKAGAAIKQTPKLIAPAKHKPKSPEQQRKEVEARVNHLKAQLESLRVVLRQLINKAQGRTVVDAKGKPVANPSVKKSSSAGSTHLTTAQKREAAKRSADYRKKHPQKLSIQDKEKQLKQQVVETQMKIAKARDDLKASVLKAREKVKNR
jgi:ribosomal protein S30